MAFILAMQTKISHLEGTARRLMVVSSLREYSYITQVRQNLLWKDGRSAWLVTARLLSLLALYEVVCQQAGRTLYRFVIPDVPGEK